MENTDQKPEPKPEQSPASDSKSSALDYLGILLGPMSFPVGRDAKDMVKDPAVEKSAKQLGSSALSTLFGPTATIIDGTIEFHKGSAQIANEAAKHSGAFISGAEHAARGAMNASPKEISQGALESGKATKDALADAYEKSKEVPKKLVETGLNGAKNVAKSAEATASAAQDTAKAAAPHVEKMAETAVNTAFPLASYLYKKLK